MTTGVLVASVAPLGRRTSACSVTPSDDGIQASDQSASGYATPAAAAMSGTADRTPMDRTRARRERAMEARTQRESETCERLCRRPAPPEPGEFTGMLLP